MARAARAASVATGHFFVRSRIVIAPFPPRPAQTAVLTAPRLQCPRRFTQTAAAMKSVSAATMRRFVHTM